MPDDPPKLWVIVGATGTGKTRLSLRLAEQLAARGRAAEIVNADAMQLYRGMQIGTAKLAEPERQGIPHHLFDELEVTDEATVAWYQPIAQRVISRIHDRERDAILVGGSGLYLSSVIFDFRFPPRNQQLRATLEREAATHGIHPLLERLHALDAHAAERVDTKNPRRVVRALEIAQLGGTGYATLPHTPTLWYPHTRILGTHCERATLVARLDQRTQEMWHHGLLDEVRSLIPQGLARGRTASRAIGYAQALAQLRGEIDQAQAIERAQALTRRYARRQRSWFARYPQVQWVEDADHLFREV